MEFELSQRISEKYGDNKIDLKTGNLESIIA
jgi:hypothetical protein